MSPIKGLVECLPALRRYARFITGSNRIGNSLCETILKESSGIERDWPSGRGSRVAAFKILSTLLNTPTCWELANLYADHPTTGELKGRLSLLTPGPRQVYLLMGMEGFTFQETMKILDLTCAEVNSKLVRAREEIAMQVATTVLIIEDEVFIARDLERIVKRLGHTVIAKARTRDAARAIISTQKPGLILADIQLADGSNGIDAVNDWLESIGEVPIIFITAFPEQLLTGNHPEPAFLLAKPYQVTEVEAAINHVLFFNAKSTLSPADPRWSIVKINGLETACPTGA